MKKRLMITLLLLIAMLGILQIPVLATPPLISGKCGENLVWDYQEGDEELQIGGTGPMDEFEDSEGAPWYWHNDFIRSAYISEGVTSISSHAFNGFECLTDLVIPTSVTSMGKAVFADCHNLSIIEFCGDAPTFAADTFSGITAVVTYPESNETWTPEVRRNYGGTLTWIAVGEYLGLESAKPVYSLKVGDNIKSYLHDIHIDAVYDNGARIRLAPALLMKERTNWYPSEAGIYTVSFSYRNQSVGVAIAAHEEVQSELIPEHLYPESSHEYKKGIDETQILTIPGANSIVLTFSNLSKIDNKDKLYIYDGSDNQIGKFYGSLSGKEVTVPGNTVKIRLVSSDGSKPYGYAFSSIYAQRIVHPGQITVVGKESTCIPGLTASIDCEICGMCTEQYPLPTLAHEYESVVTPPTLGASGFTTHTCVYCGDSYTDNPPTTYGGKCGDNAKWTLNDGVLRIFGTGLMNDYWKYDDAPWYSYCNNIRTVIIEEGITNIGVAAFYNCKNLTSISIPEGVTHIGSSAFYYCRELTSVTIPDTVVHIGTAAFYNCRNMKSIKLSSNTTTIGDYAFNYCPFLTSITIPDSVVRIGNYTFGSCSRLTDITLPANLTSIGDYAFRECNSLNQIILPDSLTRIGNYTFLYCTGLTEISLPDGLTRIGDGAFSDSGLISITIPDRVTYIGSNAFETGSLTGIWVDANNKYYSSDKYGVLFNADKTHLLGAPGAITGDYSVPDGVTNIFSRAFIECIHLEAVTIPDSVTHIGETAFMFCDALKTITFHGSAPKIGYYCFSGINAVAFYPCNDATWTQNALDSYGGKLTWVVNHSLIGDVTNNDATCTMDATMTGQCQHCGETVTVAILNTATGHRFGNDNRCVTCGAANEIVINMYDLYSDGWSGSALEVYEDGVLIATATMDEGQSGQARFHYYSGKNYTFQWVKGSSAFECSFEIIHNSNVLFNATNENCATFADGEIVYTIIGQKKLSSISGTVSSNNDTDGVTVQLFQSGSDVPASEVVVYGASATYSFSDVEAGTYTLRFTKKNHVLCEYTIDIGEVDITQDAKLCLLGDINGDGKVNMKDWSRLFDHINEVNPLSDYNLQCADVNQDGKVNMKDWSRLYDHISEISPLW